jgi:hypothetical protein
MAHAQVHGGGPYPDNGATLRPSTSGTLASADSNASSPSAGAPGPGSVGGDPLASENDKDN